jgi:hypothetical protein
MKLKLLIIGLLACAWMNAQSSTPMLSQSTLTANALATGQGPISISSPFPFIPSAPLNQGVFYAESEAMLVLSANLALNQVVVQRGYLGTTISAHNAGVLVFSGQPFQFVSTDKSGACDPNAPQYLNVTDQLFFTCTAGSWVSATTANGGGGGGTGTVTGVTATAPLTGGTIHTAGSIGCQVASASQAGCLSASDYSLFTGKAPINSPTFTGTVTLPSGQVVNGVTLNGSGSASLYLNQAGAYTTPAGGSGVTWPTSGDIVLSNSTSSPAGLAPVNGDCVIGSGGAWVAGSCSGSGGTTATAIQNGLLSARPTCATNGQIYQATDQADGQQEYNCSNFGGTFHWVQKLNVDNTGLVVTGGTLGVDHSIIGCITCANVNTALNTFAGIAGNGSAPAISNGTGTMAVNSGGTNVAGTMTSSTSGTVTFTLTWASLAYAHRAVCHFTDETTLTDSVHTTQATVPTTTTLTATGTTVSGDIVSYSCSGF